MVSVNAADVVSPLLSSVVVCSMEIVVSCSPVALVVSCNSVEVAIVPMLSDSAGVLEDEPNMPKPDVGEAKVEAILVSRWLDIGIVVFENVDVGEYSQSESCVQFKTLCIPK